MLFKRTHSDFDEESEPTTAEQWLTGVAGLAMLYALIRPGNQTAQVINAVNSGFSSSIRAAMGGAVVQDLRTAAEKFHEEAMRAIGDFWKGFTDE